MNFKKERSTEESLRTNEHNWEELQMSQIFWFSSLSRLRPKLLPGSFVFVGFVLFSHWRKT